MKDPRIQKLAANLVGYSVDVQPGENVLVEMIGSERDLLNAIIESLNNIGTKVDGMDGDMGSSIKKSLSSLKDDLDEINLPVAAKCEAIESRLKTLQENLVYGEPMKEKMEAATEGMKEALAEKFGSKTIGDVLQKLASINTFLIADSIGIAVLLALMCFFIISLIK